MLFPVPGSPINRTFLLCPADFFITSTASSWPRIWSTRLAEIFISAVDLKSLGIAVLAGFTETDFTLSVFLAAIDFTSSGFFSSLKTNLLG